jgi:hypothetical protein
MTSVLIQCEGKPPQICLDELYAAIYVASRQFIMGGFPLDQAVHVMEKKHGMIVKQLKHELRNYNYGICE